jgi:hypothetical protein
MVSDSPLVETGLFPSFSSGPSPSMRQGLAIQPEPKLPDCRASLLLINAVEKNKDFDRHET